MPESYTQHNIFMINTLSELNFPLKSIRTRSIRPVVQDEKRRKMGVFANPPTA